MKRYYKIETSNWVDDKKFSTLREAKFEIWLNYSEREKKMYFGENKGAVIYCWKDDEIVSETNFVCNDNGKIKFNKTIKVKQWWNL